MKKVNCYHAIIISRLFLPVSGYLNGYIILAVFLFTMMDERIEWNRLKKLPLLFILSLVAQCH